MPQFSVEKSLSHSTKIVRRWTHLCLKNLLVSITLFLDKKSITISSHLFVSWYRKISRRSLLFFHFFRVSKFFQDYRGNSRFSLENFLFRSTKNVRRGTLLCFRKVLVSKSFWMKSGPRFFRIFSSHGTETFRGRPFSFSLFSGIEKN